MSEAQNDELSASIMQPLANGLKNLISKANNRDSKLSSFKSSSRSSSTMNKFQINSKQNSTMDAYMKFCDVKSRDTAANYLAEAATLKGKSWLKQLQIGTVMMQQNAKRRLQRIPLQNAF